MAETSSLTSPQQGKASWTSTAFMVEAIVLLFFLIASMAVFTQLFGLATTTSTEAARLASATTLAQNAAEEFSADPASVAKGSQVGLGAATSTSGNFKVSCDVNKKKKGTGILYSAHIVVSDDNGEAYSLDAERFVEGGK
ncbi:MAG: hypothetical protein Q4A43_02600 [Coriobacteriia bacterium]|nr:hypothetical protein [Coriobacteriia bacterium]